MRSITYSCKENLVDGDALDVKHQVRVGWDARQALVAVRELGRDGKSTFATSSDAHDANIPSFDHVANAELEGKRFALLVR